MKISMDSQSTLMIWKAHDSFSIHDAALLMFGIAPEGDNHRLLMCRNEALWPQNMSGVVKLLINQLEKGGIRGNLVRYHDINADVPDVDIENSTVEVESVKKLLIQKGIYDNFFNDEDEATARYLDKSDEHYAPKLAAAVNSWMAVTSDYENIKGSTPKKKIETWLRMNAKDYGLMNDSGEHIESAISSISVIANWRPEGGAAQTPTKKIQKQATPQLAQNNTIRLPKAEIPAKNDEPNHPTKSSGFSGDFDDDIPF